MSTPALTPEPYRVKIWKDQRGELYFTIAECPACELDFSLLWPCSVPTYPDRATLHLECPGCKHTFTMDTFSAEFEQQTCNESERPGQLRWRNTPC